MPTLLHVRFSNTNTTTDWYRLGGAPALPQTFRDAAGATTVEVVLVVGVEVVAARVVDATDRDGDDPPQDWTPISIATVARVRPTIARADRTETFHHDRPSSWFVIFASAAFCSTVGGYEAPAARGGANPYRPRRRSMLRKAIFGLAVIAGTVMLGGAPVAARGWATQSRGDTTPTSSHTRHERDHSRRCEGSTVSDQDTEYLTTSIQGDHFEITGGQLAQQRAVDSSTKDLGARLVADHSKSLSDATTLAENLGIPVPSDMSDEMRAELEDAAAHTGLDFDKAYSELEVSDHMQDISDAKKEIHHGCKASVIADAQTNLPVLITHLELARETHHRIESLIRDEGNGSPTCDQSTVSSQDTEYLTTSIQGDHFEITGGQLAQQRAVDSSTKDLGARLVADHSKSLSDATTLAENLGIPVPSDMSDEMRAELEDAAAHTG